jgi:N-acyl-phosphatidylethanolamine-hydrolysing phospholipase D
MYVTSFVILSVFQEIGEKFGPLDLALIPIGAYKPRWFMSPQHVSPEDAVQLHLDVRSKLSIAMHYGTFILTDEDPCEPPVRLAAELDRLRLDPSCFITSKLGEIVTVT